MLAAIQVSPDQIDALLPQTQCTQCGYSGCRPYAEAIAAGTAEINQCPPGGTSGIAKLAKLTGRDPIPLNPVHGIEEPLHLAIIEEEYCIGCTLCIQACPVDAIVGAPKQMHTVVTDLCTGCKLCVPPCPVDCIRMDPAPFVWSDPLAAAARQRFKDRKYRLTREKSENDARLEAKARNKLTELEHAADPSNPDVQRKKAIIQAALERARKLRDTASPDVVPRN